MQSYVVKNNESPGKNYGFDEPLADGIPALQEYLAEYCDAAVSGSCFHFIIITRNFLCTDF